MTMGISRVLPGDVTAREIAHPDVRLDMKF